MAEFNVVGLDEIAESYLRREEKTVEAVPEMLKAGGEVMRKAQADEIRLTFNSRRSTGDLARSITVSKVKDVEGGKCVEVYPDKKDRHGIRNATKGFVLQYGRKNMPARPWFTAANVKAADTVNAEMRRVWEDKQNES